MATPLVAVVFIGAAINHQRAADRPIGEGQLFLDDAAYASARVMDTMHDGMETDPAIRHVRNQLTVEALAIIDGSGTVTSSTSQSLIGELLTNGLLQFGPFDRRFVVVAGPLETELQVDGVAEWNEGDVVYQALHPLEDGASLLMFYDISELLERRALAQGIKSFTLQLLGLALFFAILSAGLAFGRARAWRCHEQLESESEFLRERSADLERHNARLDEALALSEETNRVRAEFVLMINHELRTPLTGVVTGAELLASDGDVMSHADRTRLLDDIVTDGHRLKEMIGQMLAVARVENRGLNFDLSDVPAADAYREILARHPKVRAVFDRAAGLDDAHLRTDPSTLAQVASSLADNAFTHGADDVWFTVADSLPFEPMQEVGRRPEYGLFILICDNGPGIEREFLPRAFEKFEKFSRTAGTGLGLYLVAVMIDALGASLSVTTSAAGTIMAIGVPRAEIPEMAEMSR